MSGFLWLSTGSTENGNGYSDAIKVKSKGELNHRTGHDGRWRRRGRVLPFLHVWRFMAVCGQSHASATLPRERDAVTILLP